MPLIAGVLEQASPVGLTQEGQYIDVLSGESRGRHAGIMPLP